jgi:hypothetical protein
MVFPENKSKWNSYCFLIAYKIAVSTKFVYSIFSLRFRLHDQLSIFYKYVSILHVLSTMVDERMSFIHRSPALRNNNSSEL